MDFGGTEKRPQTPTRVSHFSAMRRPRPGLPLYLIRGGPVTGKYEENGGIRSLPTTKLEHSSAFLPHD